MIHLFKTSTSQMTMMTMMVTCKWRLGGINWIKQQCSGRNLKMKNEIAFTSKCWLFGLQGNDIPLFFFFFLRKLGLYQSSYALSQLLGLAQKQTCVPSQAPETKGIFCSDFWKRKLLFIRESYWERCFLVPWGLSCVDWGSHLSFSQRTTPA